MNGGNDHDHINSVAWADDRFLSHALTAIMAISVAQLAVHLGAAVQGEGSGMLTRAASLARATAECLSFLAAARYRAQLPQTRAGAVILAAADAPHCPVPALIVANPQLAFARALEILYPPPRPPAGVHATAVVAASARIDPSATVGPLCVIEDEVEIGPRTILGPGCIVQAGARIGADSHLVARVTICAGSIIGARVLLHPGAVIGRAGFGFARDGERWVRIPQVGRVRLGDDVEVGVNSTVDRGTLDDTLIGDGVKIDSLVHIGHNVTIGDHTAMAACSGISGSTRIGRNCTFAGAVGVAGHLDIGDAVHFTGMAMVTRSHLQPGVYSSGIPALPNAAWRRNVVRFRQLDQLVQRLKRLEHRVDQTSDDPAETPQEC